MEAIYSPNLRFTFNEPNGVISNEKALFITMVWGPQVLNFCVFPSQLHLCRRFTVKVICSGHQSSLAKDRCTLLERVQETWRKVHSLLQATSVRPKETETSVRISVPGLETGTCWILRRKANSSPRPIATFTPCGPMAGREEWRFTAPLGMRIKLATSVDTFWDTAPCSPNHVLHDGFLLGSFTVLKMQVIHSSEKLVHILI
jgi:hypothetical protein